MLLTALLLALVPGCKQVFGIDDPVRLQPDAPDIDAAVACINDTMCPATAPHCATAQGICVECLDASNCSDPAQPLCDPDTRTCRGCLAHTDCASAVCLPNGTCGDDSNVLYVDATTGLDTGACTQNSPCKTLLFTHTLVTTTRRYVKLTGALTASRLKLDGMSAVWLADPGTTLSGTTDPIVELQATILTVYDLEVSCIGTSAKAFDASQASTLTLHHLHIHGCGKLALHQSGGFLGIDRSLIDQNPGGGIETDSTAAFVITNTFFVRNGNSGAVSIGTSVSGQNRFEFNTVVDNMANTGSTAGRTGGVRCSTTNLMAMPNNIIARNSGYRDDTYGGCDFTQSIVGPDISTLAFKSADIAPYDYHLTTTSAAIDGATTSSLTVDYDGEARPQGPKSDVGADELK